MLMPIKVSRWQWPIHSYECGCCCDEVQLKNSPASPENNDNLVKIQQTDPEIHDIYAYLKQGTLWNHLQHQVLESSQFTLMDGVLDHCDKVWERILCEVVSQELQQSVQLVVNSQWKDYNTTTLSQRYWWKRMCVEAHWLYAWPIYSAHQGAEWLHVPPLWQIPVGMEFETAGVLKMPERVRNKVYYCICG